MIDKQDNLKFFLIPIIMSVVLMISSVISAEIKKESLVIKFILDAQKETLVKLVKGVTVHVRAKDETGKLLTTQGTLTNFNIDVDNPTYWNKTDLTMNYPISRHSGNAPEYEYRAVWDYYDLPSYDTGWKIGTNGVALSSPLRYRKFMVVLDLTLKNEILKTKRRDLLTVIVHSDFLGNKNISSLTTSLDKMPILLNLIEDSDKKSQYQYRLIWEEADGSIIVEPLTTTRIPAVTVYKLP